MARSLRAENPSIILPDAKSIIAEKETPTLEKSVEWSRLIEKAAVELCDSLGDKNVRRQPMIKALGEHIKYFMDRLDYPKDAKRVFERVNALFEENSDYGNRILKIVTEFNDNPGEENIKDILERLTILAEDMGQNPYTIHLIFFMYCSKRLLEVYKEKGIALNFYWDSMLDLRCKLIECYNVHGVWGSFVGGWFAWFFSLERFGLGRIQYEHFAFPYDRYTKDGHTVKKGDIVYNTHIPSSGPLTKEGVIDSFKAAYKFYKHELEGGPMVIVCYTWLIYPDNKKFFPAGSNILDFMDLFDIIEVKHHEKPTPSWRVFGKDYEKPFDELPRDTALQRAYVKWFLDGNTTGNAFGIILFDGENIL